MFDSKPPRTMTGQPPYESEDICLKVKAKLQRVIDRGYVELADIEFVESLMYMFHVAKGQDDIRMIYDASCSGLNKALYSPWFNLPSVDAMTRWIIAGSWASDNDYGDMFLNFPLHPSLQVFCGVDLRQLFPDPNQGQRVIGI